MHITMIVLICFRWLSWDEAAVCRYCRIWIHIEPGGIGGWRPEPMRVNAPVVYGDAVCRLRLLLTTGILENVNTGLKRSVMALYPVNIINPARPGRLKAETEWYTKNRIGWMKRLQGIGSLMSRYKSGLALPVPGVKICVTNQYIELAEVLFC